MGSMLSNGMRYNGDPQKIKLTGLTNGKAYVFSLHSQAWDAADRTCVLSCSDLSGSLTVNQNQYNSSSQDGLLVECTFIANGTEAEFTLDPVGSATWHLYAFSNREVFGWAIERGPSGNDDLTLNLSGAGNKFTKPVPMNDNSWHHIATTFGGGNKKVYVDGVQVSTASQTGSVTDSITKLLLGDSNSTGSNQPKIDDVRFYRGILTTDEVSAIYNLSLIHI